MVVDDTRPVPMGPGELDPELAGPEDDRGRPIGRWVRPHPSGTEKRVVECLDGLLHGREEIRDEDGRLRLELHWERGLPHGSFREWHASGEPEATGEFSHGKKHGLFRTFSPDGQVLTEARYRDDVPYGECASWHPDGTPQEAGAWQDGREHGRWRVWRPDGTLASETHMWQGTPHGEIRDFGPDGTLLLSQRLIHGVLADRGFTWATGLGRGRPGLGFLVVVAAFVGGALLIEPSIVIGLAALGVVILIHEAGHLLAARAVGIPIQVFQVGFGPSLASFFLGGTLIQIRLVPLLGYVRPYVQRRSEYWRTRSLRAGVDEAALPPVDPDEAPESVVGHVAPPGRLVFYLGGVTLNFLAAALVLWLVRSPADPLGALEATARLCGRVLASMPEMVARLLHLTTYTEYQPGLLGGVKDASREGASAGLLFVILNVILVAFNLLPLPLLDGFWCLKAVLEGLLRREVPRWVLAPFYVVGVVMIGLLCLTGVFFLGRDILVMIFG